MSTSAEPERRHPRRPPGSHYNSHPPVPYGPPPTNPYARASHRVRHSQTYVYPEATSRRVAVAEPIIIRNQASSTPEREFPRRERKQAPVAGSNDGRDSTASGSDGEDAELLRERVRSRSPLQRRTEWIEPDDEDVRWTPEDDVLDAATYRQFSLTWLDSLNPSTRDGESSDLDAVDEKAVSTPDEPATRGAPGVRAYTSHYAGTAEMGGDHSASITVLHDPQNQTRPLFRWLHIPQTVMNFEKFWEEASTQPGFSDGEKAALFKLRAHLRKNFIKVRYNPKGEKVGYMLPKLVEMPLHSVRDKDAPRTSSSLRGSVKWVCLEYFRLRAYSGLSAASSQAFFPSQTLLQAHYSRTSRERDLEQAVSFLGIAPSDQCFHIEQVWCLVLGNHLVTCGNMPQTELEGDIITIVSEPVRESLSAPGRILVSLGNSSHWLLSPNECATWFEFVSHFRDFWPQNLVFKHKTKQVQPENWQKLLKIAERSRAPLLIALTLEPAPLTSVRVSLNPLVSESSPPDKLNVPLTSTESYNNVHVLTLFPDTSITQIATNKVEDQLNSVEKFISQQCPYPDSKAYRTCEVATRTEVHQYLASMASRVNELDNSRIRTLYEEAIELYNYAETVFDLFLPLSFDGPTTRKFWGAVRLLTVIPELDVNSTAASSPRSVADIRLFLKNLARDIEQFQKIMRYASKEQRMSLRPNRELITAWIHVLSALIGPASWFGHVEEAEVLIEEGLGKMIRSTSEVDLQDKLAVMPAGLWSLIATRLLGNQSAGSDDVVQTYSQYLSSLDANIRDKPSDRSLQRRIDLVQQEIDVIRSTLSNQQNIINTLRTGSENTFTTRIHHRSAESGGPLTSRTYRPPAHRHGRSGDHLGDHLSGEDHGTFRLGQGSPPDLNTVFLADCRAIIEQRADEFRRYWWYADDLSKAIANKVDWTKDRQENAIYAFTVVTIVFLPISAVSSIFGMNTSDVRDMNQGQWLYWAVALPVTLGVIVGGLWWMGELDAVAGWFMRASHRSTRLPVPASFNDQDGPQPLLASERPVGISSRWVRIDEPGRPPRRRRESEGAYYSDDDLDLNFRAPVRRPEYIDARAYRSQTRRY
ncbi:hypothetical protein NLU13_1995 [Sarocladium strictum]|uniref:Mg2+ transporter n=1 Tax=Sarocladium strictum TaxID=5046 RepID=A0AA39GS00_SARSR|nr:hypothetical protein NLU13_1995 [Sarocladium strictum]